MNGVITKTRKTKSAEKQMYKFHRGMFMNGFEHEVPPKWSMNLSMPFALKSFECNGRVKHVHGRTHVAK